MTHKKRIFVTVALLTFGITQISLRANSDEGKPNVPQNNELSYETRDQLKANLTLTPSGSKYVWKYPKAAPIKGNEELEFKNPRKIGNLNPGLQKLMSQPWYSVIDQNQFLTAGKEAAPFSKLPIMGLKVVDIDTMPVYHATTLAAVPSIVQLDPAGDLLHGRLNGKDLRFTNPDMNPAFYTFIEPRDMMTMGLTTTDAIAKINVHDKKNVVVLELVEPVSTDAQTRFFELLTGDKDFWPKYVQLHKKGTDAKGNVYDYDLFHNATVTALRDYNKIPVDMIIYSKDYMFHSVTDVESIYNWSIIFDRRLLLDAEVPKIFNNMGPTFLQVSPGNGVDESRMVPFTKRTFDAYSKYPDLAPLIDDTLGSTAISRDLKDFIMKSPDDFWRKFDGFESFFYSADSKPMNQILDTLNSSGFDKSKIVQILHDAVTSFVQDGSPKAACIKSALQAL